MLLQFSQVDQCEQSKVASDLEINKEWKRHEVKVKSNGNKTKNTTEKTSNRDTKAYRAITESFNFIEFFGRPLGWNLDYAWKGGARACLVIGYLIFTWSQFLYSKFQYFAKSEHMKFFEVFAVYGIAISVILRITDQLN